MLISIYIYAGPLSPESSSGSEEEMEVQDWRVKSYLQEEYLKTIRNTVRMIFDLYLYLMVVHGLTYFVLLIPLSL